MLIFGKPRYLGIASFPDETVVTKGEQWIVQSARGKEIAVIAGPISPEQETVYREIKRGENQDTCGKGGEPPLQDLECLEPASIEDLQLADEERTEEEAVLLRSREILRNHNLSMKLVDVEFLLDRKKLFFYFTAEQRIDFRAFVRDLAREFKTRIELRQIGIRDEAKVVEGLAPCGNPCCCSYWLNRFAPICIRMVKEQNLALNPTKISGLCGRLMCCMSYEHENYKRLWDHLPNPGSKVRAPQGIFILAGVDVHAEAVRVLTPDRSEILVPVDRFEEFRDTVMKGNPWETETSLPELNEPVAVPTPEKPRKPRSREKTESEGRKGKKRPPRSPRPAEQETASEPQEPLEGSTPSAQEQEKKRPPRKRKRRRKKPSGGKEAHSDTPQKNGEGPKAKPAQGKNAESKDGTPGDGTAAKKPARRRRRRKRPQDASSSAQTNTDSRRNPSGKTE